MIDREIKESALDRFRNMGVKEDHIKHLEKSFDHMNDMLRNLGQVPDEAIRMEFLESMIKTSLVFTTDDILSLIGFLDLLKDDFKNFDKLSFHEDETKAGMEYE